MTRHNLCRKIIGISILFFLINLNRSFAQETEFQLQNYNPVSPSAFQFLKYSEMPVSEYTGIPNISIPIYDVKEDGIDIPVNLTYHGGGIRVHDEASWVGLGWDLEFGSIVQQINNIDDYSATKREQPDFQNYGIPTYLPMRYDYFHDVPGDGTGWSNPYPIYQGNPSYSYAIATNYYMPINGNFDDQLDGQEMCLEGSNSTVDSDPDIFRASFLGHYITFIWDWKNDKIVVLNKKGYVVTRSGDTYEIIDPKGEEFYFEKYVTVTSHSSSIGGIGNFSDTSPIPSSKI